MILNTVNNFKHMYTVLLQMHNKWTNTAIGTEFGNAHYLDVCTYMIPADDCIVKLIFIYSFDTSKLK